MEVIELVKLQLKEYLDQRGITRYYLAQKTNIRFHIIDNYYKNKVVRYDSYVLDRICTVLNCSIADIVVYTKDEDGEG